MSFESHALLERLASQLRREIAPAVDDEYQRTQTHMAGVILQRLAREAALGERHREAEAADMARLATDVSDVLDSDPASAGDADPQANRDAGQAEGAGRGEPPASDAVPWAFSAAVPEDVCAALERLQGDGSVMSLGPLVEALYRWGAERPMAAAALDAIRPVLRRDIDRRMEIAR